MSDSEDHWIPDEEANACNLCHSEFSAIFRRHHCRACGKLVCGNCSAHRLELRPGVRERVCDNCEVQFTTEHGTGLAESLKVKSQMAASMKGALQEKHKELERFRTLLIGMLDGQAQQVPVMQNLAVVVAQEKTEDYLRIREELQRERQTLIEADKKARLLARRTLQAEAEARKASDYSREIHDMQDLAQKQDTLVDKLRERIARMESTDSPQVDGSSPRLVRSEGARVSLLTAGQGDSLRHEETSSSWSCRQICSIS
jgi:FYVE zinc finger